MKKIMIFIFIALFSVGLAACEKDTPAEKAGKKINKAFDDAKKKIKKNTK